MDRWRFSACQLIRFLKVDNINLDLGQFDADVAMPHAEPLDTVNPADTQRSTILRLSTDELQQEQPTDIAAAPMQRRRKGPRVLALDNTQEFGNADLRTWHADYVQNMVEAARKKTAGRLLSLAKVNALHWLCNDGIGSIGSLQKEFRLSSLLQGFCGPEFLDLVTGLKSPADRKRSRTDSDDDEESSSERRVRLRHGSTEEVGRGVEADIDINDDPLPLMDDEVCHSNSHDAVSYTHLTLPTIYSV